MGSVQQQQQGRELGGQELTGGEEHYEVVLAGQRDEFFKNTLKWFNPNDHNAAKL